MNIDCGCYAACKQTLQVGDSDTSMNVLMPIRIFGTRDGGVPTVWLAPDQITRLIDALVEAKTKRLALQARPLRP